MYRSYYGLTAMLVFGSLLLLPGCKKSSSTTPFTLTALGLLTVPGSSTDSLITLSGTAFSDNATVTVAGVKANIKSQSSTRIVLALPSVTTVGQVPVVVTSGGTTQTTYLMVGKVVGNWSTDSVKAPVNSLLAQPCNAAQPTSSTNGPAISRLILRLYANGAFGMLLATPLVAGDTIRLAGTYTVSDPTGNNANQYPSSTLPPAQISLFFNSGIPATGSQQGIVQVVTTSGSDKLYLELYPVLPTLSGVFMGCQPAPLASCFAAPSTADGFGSSSTSCSAPIGPKANVNLLVRQ